MTTITLNQKGQITIPHRIRRILGLRSGDEFELVVQENVLMLKPKEHQIEAAFGLYQATHSVSIEEMDLAIRKRGAHDRD